MAEKDITEKAFIALNDVFADNFNVLVFSGKQIVAADALEDLKTSSQYKADDGTLHEQERYGEDPRMFIDGKKEGVKVMDYVLEYREEKGRREGRAEALFALIDALKDVYTDKEDIYQRVISYESYRNLSREEVFKYL